MAGVSIRVIHARVKVWNSASYLALQYIKSIAPVLRLWTLPIHRRLHPLPRKRKEPRKKRPSFHWELTWYLPTSGIERRKKKEKKWSSLSWPSPLSWASSLPKAGAQNHTKSTAARGTHRRRWVQDAQLVRHFPPRSPSFKKKGRMNSWRKEKGKKRLHTDISM